MMRIILILLIIPAIAQSAVVYDHNFNDNTFGGVTAGTFWGIQSSGGISGSAYARCAYSTAGTPGKAIIIPVSSYASNTIWVEFYARASSGMSGGSKFIKFFGLDPNSGADTANNLTLGMLYEANVNRRVSYFGDTACTATWAGGNVYNATKPEQLVCANVQHPVTGGDIDIRGTSWHHYKAMVKRANPGQTNGEIKVWWNGNLHAHLTNMPSNPSHSITSPYLKRIEIGGYNDSRYFNGSTWYLDVDNLYVGTTEKGSAGVGPALFNPEPSSSLQAGTTSTDMAITTDVNATCRYSTTAGLDYSTMPLSFSGAGTTNHSRTLTGLTNGSSTNYYVRCAKTSDGSVNTSDYPINVSVLSPQYSLGVLKSGTGNGTIVSALSGINCGSSCSDSFDENSSVVLTAASDSGSTFDSWSGCDSVVGNQCTVNMTSNRTVTAVFNSVTISCDSTHFWACSDGPCQALGFYYYDGACRTIQEPADWTGLNIAENGNFSSWSNELPVLWGTYTPALIIQDLGACSIAPGGHIYRAIPEIKNYRYVANMRSFPNNFEIWTDDQNSYFHQSSEGQTRTITGLISYDGVGDPNVYFQGQGIIDDIVIKELASLEPIPGECGSANGSTVSSLLITNPDLCAQGEAANLSETWPKTWDCLGYNGGTPDLGCTAYLQQQVSGISASGSFFYNTSPENNNFPYTVPFILE